MNPRVNLNGTSGDELLAQVDAVLAGLRKTESAMVEASPHGRDYQHDPSGVDYRVAREEHNARVAKVRDLILWYEDSQLNIFNQVMARAAAREARMAR